MLNRAVLVCLLNETNSLSLSRSPALGSGKLMEAVNNQVSGNRASPSFIYTKFIFIISFSSLFSLTYFPFFKCQFYKKLLKIRHVEKRKEKREKFPIIDRISI